MIDDYLRRVRGTLRSLPSLERHGRTWKRALAGKTLRQVTPGDIERYVASRVGGAKPATVNRELAFLKRVFNVAIADALADANPVRAVRLLKENNARVRFLTDEEEPRLRAAIGEEHWPLIVLAMHTGTRQGNQFSLRWDDVDFTTGIITARRAKSGEAYRLPMNDLVRETLRALPARLKSPWVFPSQTGRTPINAKNFLGRVFLPAVRRAGIQDFRWHDLRHTFASRLFRAGVDLRTVQELMGHKVLAMTLRYSHLSPAHQREAVQPLVTRTGTTTGTASSSAAEPASTDPLSQRAGA